MLNRLRALFGRKSATLDQGVESSRSRTTTPP